MWQQENGKSGFYPVPGSDFLEFNMLFDYPCKINKVTS